MRDLLSSLDGVRVVVGSEELGTPESAWGDTFAFYDPDTTGAQKMPFATIVIRDTPGWDEVSYLDRPGAFRVNLNVGRDNQPEVEGEVDYAQDDVVLPHPQYATQGWVAVVNPGDSARVEQLVRLAYERAVARHRPA